jgi:hypothetical protein
MRPHEEFIELCAVSTTGSLTEVEKAELEEHLSGCPSCRQVLREYQSTAEIGLPLFAAGSGQALPGPTDLLDRAESVLMANLGQAHDGETEVRASGFDVVRVRSHWNYMWLAFGATVVLAGILGAFAYQSEFRHWGSVNKAEQVPVAAPAAAQVSTAAAERDSAMQQVTDLKRAIEGLRAQLEKRTEEVSQLRQERNTLEAEARKSEEQHEQLTANQAAVSQKLEISEAALDRTQRELDALKSQRLDQQESAQALKARVEGLSGEVRDKDRTIDEQQDLLAHDRDIRELMGARDLYIAEVFDVAKTGATQKPYGRVFFTKGKSLIFYAFDLDRQSGFKNTSSFQAWGQRGLDRQDSLSLGIFYEDSASKKRWILKSTDPQKLDEINAVFVTVEPHGGSQKPSGKPLLYAYLKVRPNHP